MSKFRSIKNSLIAGEISPTALGRTDLAQYGAACKTLRNMIPLLGGGAGRRPGSFYESKLSLATDTAPNLIPFIYSQTEAYCIALNTAYDGNDGYTFQAKWFRPTGNHIVSTTGSVAITGTITLGLGNAGPHGVSERPYDDVFDIQYVQSADILYVAHPKQKPLRLTRVGVESFTLKEFDDGLTGAALRDAYPYRPQNTSSTTIAPSATSGTNITLTASSAIFNNPGHIGALIKINHAGTIGCARITGVTSSTVATADVVVNFGGTSSVTTWWESAWSNYRGWPSAICFFQQRLCYGGNTAEPDTIWLSESSDFNQLSHDTIIDPRSSPTGSKAFTIQLTSSQLNRIQWLSPEVTLVVGTTGDEFIIDREINTAGFGCDNASVLVQTHYGSSYHRAVRIGNELLFCLRSDDELRALVFSQLEDSYTAEPVQSLFDEYPKVEPIGFNVNRKIRKFEWDESRKTLWCVDTAGNLYGLTRDRRLSLSSWHTHQMGGYDPSEVGSRLVFYTVPSNGVSEDPIYRACSGSVASLSVVPNPLIGTNDIWLAVKRKVNGNFEFHIERIIGKPIAYDSVYNRIDFKNGGYLVDAAVNVGNRDGLGATISTWPGFDHLEGKTPVGVASNDHGFVTTQGTAVVAGSTTLATTPPSYNSELTQITLGYHFDSIVEPVSLEAGSQIGTSQGAVKRITKATVRFYKTLHAKVGRDANHLETIDFRTGSTPMGKSAELFTGNKQIDFPGDYDTEGNIYILQDKPLPMTVISIIAEGQTYD